DPKLEDATRLVYRKELREGRMSFGELKGIGVEEARDAVKRMLLESGDGILLYEVINRPVRCRCGGIVEVKIFDDQWFIDYGNEEWKKLARECLASMSIVPEERRKDFEYAIEWLQRKACTRASGLGTRFPFDKTKMIEALSDSTMYMAFYTVRHKLRRPLSVEEWDYVMLGKGNGNSELDELRKSFEYWYPLDSRHSGADLIYNHLPFFIFNHARVFDRDKWPKQIVVNGFVLMEGQKMSKSLGNILPLRKAIKEYGPDPIRLSVVGGAGISDDTDFNRAMIEGIISRLRFMSEVSNNLSNHAQSNVERWLEQRFVRYYNEGIRHYDRIELKEIVNDAIYKFTSDVKWCMKRKGRPTRNMFKQWLKLIAPMCPHYCDEMWESIGEKGFVTGQVLYPEIEYEVDMALEEGERVIKQTVEDIAEIRKLVGRQPKKIVLIVANEFKREVFEGIGDVKNINEALKKVMGIDKFRKNAKEAAALVKSAIKWKPEVVLSEENEYGVLLDAGQFMEEECGAPVEVILEKDAPEHMKEKAVKALPGKPCIFFEV
ncbi:MAG: class I tRNA ligase family protein, partial [Candidatus Micrarchaeia archaeon]